MKKRKFVYGGTLGLALALLAGCSPGSKDSDAQASSLRDSLNTVIAELAADSAKAREDRVEMDLAAANQALLDQARADLALAIRQRDNRRPYVMEKPAGTVTETPAAVMNIPAGTDIVATLDSRLDTGNNNSGDAFSARTNNALMVDGRTLLPAGTRINGVIRDVEEAGRVSGRASMTLVFEQLVDAQGRTQSLNAVPITVRAASQARGDAEKIAAGTVLGAIVGGATKGKKGAVIGAGTGAGVGTVVMLATKGKDVELESGHQLNIHTTSVTTLSN